MKKKPEKKPADMNQWLEKISSQLERMIICMEKRLSGEVLREFNSEQHLKTKKEV